MAAWPTLRSCRGRPGRCWRSGPVTTRPSTSPSPSSARRRRGVTLPAGPPPTGTPGTRPPHAPRRRPGPPPPRQYPGPVRQLQPSRTGPPDGQTIGYPRQDLRLLPQPSLTNAEAYTTTRSYLHTASKYSTNRLDVLRQLPTSRRGIVRGSSRPIQSPPPRGSRPRELATRL